MSENIKQGFETWKENNPKCLRVDTITDPKYLENRLWHAYNGGLNERGAELDAAQESLRAERIMRDKMKSEVESITNSLRIERLECDRLRKELERLREENRWIPVSERLPEMFKNVLAFSDKHHSTSERSVIAITCVDASGVLDNYALGHDGKFTHWRPLPALPK